MVRQLSAWAVFPLFLVLIFASSCTRQVERSTGISINIPSDVAGKIGSFSANELGHLIVNVTGPGINPPVFFTWDSHEGQNTPPPFFAVDVLEGSNRLIQVLAVYRDSTTEEEVFYYGDKNISITGDVNVQVVVLPIGVSAQKEAQIFGRYLPLAGNPVVTGAISIHYNPPGKPSMLIQKSEMFGGFFRLFGLDNVPFDYRLPNGVSLFGGPVDTTNTSVFRTANTLEVFMPNHYQERCDPSCTYEPRNESKVIVGWFGPGASSKNVCFPNTTPTIYGMYSDTLPTNMNWDPNYGGSTGSSPHPITALGTSGSSDGEGLCTSTGSRFVDYLSLDAENLANRDEIAAFRGPYIAKYHLSKRDVFRVSTGVPTTNDITFEWEYLPGARTDAGASPPLLGVDGSAVFFKDISGGGFNESQIRVEDGVACGQLPGFTKLFEIPAATDSASYVMNSASTYISLISSYNAVYVLCPYANVSGGRKYFKSGAVFRPQGP